MPRISTDNYDTVASWNGSQDLFVVEQPDGTKVATPALLKQYVLGNSIDDIYSVMGQMGAKNLNIFPYKNGGAGDTWESSGITFTVNADGTIEANGTATADAYFRCGTSTDDSNPIYLEAGKSYILSGSGVTGVGVIVRDTVETKATAGETDVVYNCTTSGKHYILVVVRKQKTVDHFTIKPMLRLASDTDNTYQPYAMTNKQLTENKADKTDIESVYSVMGQMGAKNLIPYPYPKMSTTVRGITWSDNGDGGIVGNGTGTEASLQPYCELNGSSTNNAKDLLLKANTWYKLTCKRTSPYAIGANIYFLDPTTIQQTSITFDVIYGDSAQTTATKNNVFMYNAGVVSEEVKFKLPQDMYAQVQVRYKAGTNVTVSNDVQYPMLRLASDTDNTYQPYAKTNKQLTDGLDTTREQIADVNSQITGINSSLLPIDAIVKRFYINNGNTSLDTGINVNQAHTTGFAAVVSTFGTYNAGVASVYIGGVAHRKQDGTVGDLNYARLGGVGIGESSDGSNMQFSVVNDKLQLRTYQYQVGACVTLILSKR